MASYAVMSYGLRISKALYGAQRPGYRVEMHYTYHSSDGASRDSAHSKGDSLADKRDEASYESFCEAARGKLEHETDRLLSGTIERLIEKECTWHPNGFAVFHIEDHHDLGKLRLHIWPNSKRVTRTNGPPIHSHVWHLCSRVLVGTYGETLYIEAQPDAGGREYHSADINYSLDRNSFSKSGKSHLRALEKITVTAGQFHAVQAGIPHETLIDENTFVATLLFTSIPTMERASVFDAETIPASSYTRPVLTHEEKLKLLRHLKEELNPQAFM